MSTCAQCGLLVMGEGELCANHESQDTIWARENAIWCAFFHRGVEPRRLSKEERDDEAWWTTTTTQEPCDG